MSASIYPGSGPSASSSMTMRGPAWPLATARSSNDAAARQVESDGREVRIERWSKRRFLVAPCAFRVDLPLDMSGCIVSALREVREGPWRRPAGGLVLASDARCGGAVFIEVDAKADDSMLATIDGDVLGRAMPQRPSMRPEVDELMRWSRELGRDVASFFVAFIEGTRPRSFVPTRLLATLDGGAVHEEFEIAVPARRFVARAR